MTISKGYVVLGSAVRILSIDDYDSLLDLWQASGLDSMRPNGRDSRESVARQLSSGVQTILGIEVGGQLAGAIIATHDSRKGWLNRLVVRPEFRRRGLGRELIAAAEDCLEAQGLRVTAALIEDDNTASLALFRAAGYIEADPPIHYLSKRKEPGA